MPILETTSKQKKSAWMLCSPQAQVWDVEVGPEGGEGVTGRRRTLTAPHASSLESRGTSLQRWRGSPAACSCPVPGPLSFDSPALHPASWTARGLARGGREGGPAREGVKERRKTEKSSWNSSPGVWPRRRPKPGETFRLPRCTPSQLPLQSQGLSPLVAAPNRKHHRRPGSVETPTGRGDVLPCGKEPVARMKQCPSWCQHCKSENEVSR